MRDSRKLLKIKIKDFLLIVILLLIFGTLGWGMVITYFGFIAVQSPVLMFMLVGLIALIASVFISIRIIRGTRKVLPPNIPQQKYDIMRDADELWNNAIKGSAVSQRIIEEKLLSAYIDLLVAYIGCSEKDAREMFKKPEMCKKILKNDRIVDIAVKMWRRRGDLKNPVEPDVFRKEVEEFLAEIEKLY